MPEKKFLAIWGASGHAKVVADIVRLNGDYTIYGFIDDINLDHRNTEFCGAVVLGGQEQLPMLLDRGIINILLGFGDCRMRLKRTLMLHEEGFTLPLTIHPSAVVAGDVELGQGTVIAAGAIVNPGAKIGKSVIINTSASVDHECIIADAAHICPGAHLAGRVVIGQATQIGIGATVIDRVKIGAGAIIGAGAVVVDDIPDRVVAYGVPARIMRKIDE